MLVNKIFILNGRNINSLEDFHTEVQNVLCPEFDFYGRNWDAFNDILRGGFGSFDYDENITIIFKERNYVEKQLGEGFLETFIEIVALHDTIELVFD